MTPKKPTIKKEPVTAELRRQAEARLAAKKEAAPPLAKADALHLVHELQVHQIEMEMQNDELIRTRAEVEATYRQYTDLYDFAPVGYFTLAQDGTIRQVNLAGARLLGLERTKLIDRRLGLFVSAASQPIFNGFLQKLQSGEGKETCDVSFLKNGNETHWAHIEASCFEGGQESRAVLMDVTERKQAEDALRENQELFSLFMQYSPIYAFIKQVTPEVSRVLQASDNYQDMIGISSRDMMGRSMHELFPPESAAKFTADDWAVVSGGMVLKLDEELNGRYYTTIKFPIALGDKTLLAGYTIDITERVQAQVELQDLKDGLELVNRELQTALTREQQLARTDVLTGISNRRSLYEIAEHEFEIAVRYQQALAVIMLDIDRFKQTNDTFGHAAGDEVLERVAHVALAELRSADTIGRYGGEEFVIILPVTNAGQAYTLAERIRLEVERLRVSAPKGEAAVTLSIGIAELTQASPAESVDELFRRADEAMYAAKQAGRNRTEISGQ